MLRISQPLALFGAKNVRDLGGYPTGASLVTKKQAFLRGDALHNLTGEDCRQLFDYGVRCVIDLRSAEEIGRAPDRLSVKYPEIEYVHIPIQDHIHGARYTEDFPPSMWQLYGWILDDSGDKLRAVFETMARLPNDCVLFHCTGGKDRTGIVAMLLLELAGVEDALIIEDYAVTAENMKDIFPLQTAQLEAMGLTVPPHVMESPPENMVYALEHLRSRYGSAEKYLLRIGLSEEQIACIREKLTLTKSCEENTQLRQR